MGGSRSLTTKVPLSKQFDKSLILVISNEQLPNFMIFIFCYFSSTLFAKYEALEDES